MTRKLKKETEKLERRDIITERPPNTSKYLLKYGETLRELAIRFGVSKSTIFNWLKDPKKREWLEQKLKENN